MLYAEVLDVKNFRKWFKKPKKYLNLKGILGGIRKKIKSHFKNFLADRSFFEYFNDLLFSGQNYLKIFRAYNILKIF